MNYLDLVLKSGLLKPVARQNLIYGFFLFFPLLCWAPQTLSEEDPAIKMRDQIKMNENILKELAEVKAGDEIWLPWLDNSVLLAQVRSVNKHRNIVEVMGSVPDFEIGHMSLSIGHGLMVGNITLDTANFRIHRLQADLYAIDEINVPYLMPQGPDSDAFVDFEVVHASKNGKITSYHAPGNTFNRIRKYTAQQAPDKELKKLLFKSQWRDNGFTVIPDGEKVIDIMVAYTSQAKAWVENDGSNIDLEIQQMIAKTNSAYHFSGVNAFLNLVHTTEVNYVVEDPTYQSDMDKLNTDNDGVLDDLLILRNQYKADLVNLLVRKVGGKRGYAWVPRPDTLPQEGDFTVYDPYGEKHGFSIVEIKPGVQGMTFPHEISHNLGAHHDFTGFNQTIPISDPTFHNFARGWVILEERVRTIMSYNNLCSDEGLGVCDIVPFFSNPKLDYKGFPLGDPVSGTSPYGPANNVEAMNQFVWSVSNYRNSTSP